MKRVPGPPPSRRRSPAPDAAAAAPGPSHEDGPIEPDEHYRRVVQSIDPSLADGTITWCRAANVAAVLPIDPDSAVPQTLSDAFDLSINQVAMTGRGRTVVIGELDGWFLVLEPNDWNSADRIAALSRGGEAVSLVIGDTLRHYHLHVARDGEQVCRFRWGDAPEGEPPSLAGDLALETPLDFDVWKTRAFVLAERLTGVRVTTEWLAAEHTGYRVPTRFAIRREDDW
ncbi:DUF6461 domain-containing protein [Herbidospora sp. NBRC 101105]|uniref:DUF6461 domain-containing protein n=1 Tax=Herbidospora sp. NBRC 101105 TaxID=3032195 RepID=UPI0024A5B244|nr:DUF6461 domain-containing protein [Herbidospora sp. NBRC 101105]GLX93277.1 hypothetical protein Hesp01_12270 [Herbidospora sp. NBRC 101105]